MFFFVLFLFLFLNVLLQHCSVCPLGLVCPLWAAVGTKTTHWTWTCFFLSFKSLKDRQMQKVRYIFEGVVHF